MTTANDILIDAITNDVMLDPTSGDIALASNASSCSCCVALCVCSGGATVSSWTVTISDMMLNVSPPDAGEVPNPNGTYIIPAPFSCAGNKRWTFNIPDFGGTVYRVLTFAVGGQPSMAVISLNEAGPSWQEFLGYQIDGTGGVSCTASTFFENYITAVSDPPSGYYGGTITITPNP